MCFCSPFPLPSLPSFLPFSLKCLQFYFVTKKKFLHVWPKAKGECQVNSVISLRINDGVSTQHALGFLCLSFAKVNLWAAQYLFGRRLNKSLITQLGLLFDRSAENCFIQSTLIHLSKTQETKSIGFGSRAGQQ